MIFPLILFFEKKNAAEFLLYEENKSWRKKKEEKMKEASVCSSLWSHGNYAKLPLLAAVTNHRVKAEDTKLITFNCCSIPPQFFLWYLPKKKRSKCVILTRKTFRHIITLLLLCTTTMIFSQTKKKLGKYTMYKLLSLLLSCYLLTKKHCLCV